MGFTHCTHSSVVQIKAYSLHCAESVAATRCAYDIQLKNGRVRNHKRIEKNMNPYQIFNFSFLGSHSVLPLAPPGFGAIIVSCTFHSWCSVNVAPTVFLCSLSVLPLAQPDFGAMVPSCTHHSGCSGNTAPTVLFALTLLFTSTVLSLLWSLSLLWMFP